jgi:ABC-type multidrug transport system ATPase subunit/pSer/pThr/pTyr-binding forkhead associated (FHA) protein
MVSVAGLDRLLTAGASYGLGRDPSSDIVFDDPRVSWQHAVLRFDQGEWVLADSGSKNGIFTGPRRVSLLRITGDCVVRLADSEDGPEVWCRLDRPDGAGAGSQLRVDLHPTSVRQIAGSLVRIGRAPENDVVVTDLGVSRYHAELRRVTARQFEIVDAGSHNGTFVNGRRISAVAVTGADLIGIGPATFRLVDGELREFIDEGDVSLLAQDLTVRLPDGRILLDHVSFPVGERRLVAIIGPSGAGKSTLLGALTGMRPADEGTVSYDGRDLYQHYAELRHRIGYVPQKNIWHVQLSALRALRYAAELRFPSDTSAAERSHRVDEVLSELGLTGHSRTRGGALSGGQQKRVNVALELLTKPSLLFLDEPTSGVDPDLDKAIMELLAELARAGRTVIVVTHSVAHLDMCDDLLVLSPGGRLAYYGPPAEGLAYFGKQDWADVFKAFRSETGRDWAGQFRDSMALRAQEQQRPPSGAPAMAGQPGGPRPGAPRSRAAQLAILCRRYLAVIASDRNYLAVLGILPVALGLLLRAVPAPQGLTGHANADAESLLLVLAIGACLAGTASSVRELVAERAIYLRERAAGLSAGAYVWSKLLVLGVLSCTQAIVIAAIGLAGRPMPAHGAFLTSAPLAEIMLAVGLLATASMTIGLVISAAVSNAEKTMPLLVLASMVQIILSGGVIALPGKAGLEQLAWITPSRWGFGATAATVNLNRISPPGEIRLDPVWDHRPATWLTDMALQLLLAAIFTAIAWQRLARQHSRT